MHYYFDVHDGREITDESGTSFVSLEDARQHAAQVASSYAAKPEMLGEDGGAIIVSVRTAEDRVVLTVRLAFSVEIPRPR